MKGILVVGASLAICIPAAGCSFDPNGISPGANGDAPNAPDAGTAAQPDAEPGSPKPDAATDPGGTAELGVLESHRVSTPPVLDGVPDEWAPGAFTTFSIADAVQFYGLEPGYGYDAEVRFASMHDDHSIYFFLSVTDDQLVDDSEFTYQDDAIELYLDASGDDTGPYAEDDHWLVLGSSNTYQSLGPAGIMVSGAVVETAAGYDIEIAIDKGAMGAAPMPPMLGFDLGLVDDDGLGDTDADAYGLWYRTATDLCPNCCEGEESPQAWCDTSLFGRLVLLP